jgi:hypothetical protein
MANVQLLKFVSNFRNKTPDELVSFLKVSEGERYPAPDKLTPSLALYWATLAKYFKDEDNTDYLEKILGTVSELTLYVNWLVWLINLNAPINNNCLQLLQARDTKGQGAGRK